MQMPSLRIWLRRRSDLGSLMLLILFSDLYFIFETWLCFKGISYMRVLGFLGLCGHYEDEFLKDAAVRLEDEFAGEFLDYTVWKMNFWVYVFCLLFVLLLLGRRNMLLKLSMLYSAVEWYPWYPCVAIHDGSVIVLHCLPSVLPSALILFVQRWHRVLYFNSCCSMILGRNLYKGS